METNGLIEAAKLARCHPDTLRKLACSGVVPAAKATSGRSLTVVAYRVSAATAFLLRTLKLVKVRYFSPPTLHADEHIDP